MPRNHDEAVEWPEEVDTDLSEVLRRLELSETYSQTLEDDNDDLRN